MGWHFDGDTTKTDCVLGIIKGFSHPVLDHAVVGEALYALIDHPTYGPLIAVYLISYDRKSQQWGYKPMSEDMGPRVLSCPRRILAKSKLQEPNAVQWRLDCEEWHRQQAEKAKARKALKPGTLYQFAVGSNDPAASWFENYGGSPTAPCFWFTESGWMTTRRQRIKAAKSWGLKYHPTPVANPKS